jgi:hypothetical protein
VLLQGFALCQVAENQVKGLEQLYRLQIGTRSNIRNIRQEVGMKTIEQITNELRQPFKASEIEWRVQSCGKNKDGFWAMVLAYVQNRAIQERLDEVFGVDGWQNALKELPNGGMSCGISAKINGEWITKWDGADNTDIETTKGGISNAMKRSAVQWGIGRYLYNLDVVYAEVSETKQKDWHFAQTKEKERFYWQEPKLPEWALPKAKSLVDEAIEDLAKKSKMTGEMLQVFIAKNFSKLMKSLTVVEKQSLVELLKKEVNK